MNGNSTRLSLNGFLGQQQKRKMCACEPVVDMGEGQVSDKRPSEGLHTYLVIQSMVGEGHGSDKQKAKIPR